jgi:hypothetical protein
MLVLARQARGRIRIDSFLTYGKAPAIPGGGVMSCMRGGILTLRDRAPQGRQWTAVAVATILMLVSANAHTLRAQNQPGMGGTNVVARGGSASPYDCFGYEGYGMPGTAQSATEYGMASMIAASGYANLQNSIAVKNIEAARSQDINNRAQWTNAYHEMRQAHRAYMASHSRLSMDEITKIASDAAPKRADATQLDPATGKITWPISLEDRRYVALTDELENLYWQRATVSGSINAGTYRNIRRACDELLSSLKRNISDYRPDDFISASRLVKSLRYEARFPANSGGVGSQARNGLPRDVLFSIATLATFQP